MFRVWTVIGCWATWALVVGVGAGHAVSRPSETLFPETTDVWFSARNVGSLEEHWNQTQLGHLMADPVMTRFARQLSWKFEDEWSDIQGRLALTLDDIKRVATGEAAVGRIGHRPGKLALCIIVDVSGKSVEARSVLKQADARQMERGSSRSEMAVGGHTIYQYIPSRQQPRSAGVDARRAFYCMADGLLVASDSLDVLKGVLSRATGIGKKGNSLAGYVPFETVMLRCQLPGGASVFQVRWFMNARAAMSGDRGAKIAAKAAVGRNIATARGVGGLIAFSTDGYQISHRTAVYAPRPIRAVATAAALPSRPDFTPQPWVPDDISTYTTLYVDLSRNFNTVGPAADRLFGHDAAATWREIVDSLENDPHGPRIDVREDLIAHLGPRVTFVTDYWEPITATSNRLLIAIEASDQQAVTSAIERFFANDPTFRKRNHRGLEVWELAPKRLPEAPSKVGFGDAPPLTRPVLSKKDIVAKERGKLLPHAAITVWNGNLMIASHLDFLLKVVAPRVKQKPLTDDPVYRLVRGEISKSPVKGECLEFFSRTDEEYRPTYELIRRNEVPPGESMADRALSLLFGDKKGLAIGLSKLDGSRLPDYETVRPYLGPAGLRVTREMQGWFAEGVTLTKAPIVARAPASKR